jgi:hypothetical protein
MKLQSREKTTRSTEYIRLLYYRYKMGRLPDTVQNRAFTPIRPCHLASWVRLVWGRPTGGARLPSVFPSSAVELLPIAQN